LVKAVTPQIGGDDKGNPFIWWIEEDKAAKKNIVRFALSDGKGNFNKSISVPVTLGCNDGHGQGMPKMIFKKDGTLIAVYSVKASTEKNRFAGKIFYSQSLDYGKTWSVPAVIHSDTLPDNGHAFPEVELLPNGEVVAVWLDGRNHLPYSELFMAVTEGRAGFKNERKIGGPACQCCKLDFYVDRNKNVHLLYRGILDNSIRDIMHLSSGDNFQTASAPLRISKDEWKIDGCPHAGPSMTAGKDSLHFVWYTMGGGEGIFYCSADRRGTAYSAKENLGKAVAKYPHITAVGENKIAIVWQEFFSDGSREYPRIKMQLRENGKILKTIFVTPEGASAAYPNVWPLNSKEIIIAYETTDEKGNSSVVVKKMTL
jgi:hypothetical protein